MTFKTGADFSPSAAVSLKTRPCSRPSSLPVRECRTEKIVVVAGPCSVADCENLVKKRFQWLIESVRFFLKMPKVCNCWRIEVKYLDFCAKGELFFWGEKCVCLWELCVCVFCAKFFGRSSVEQKSLKTVKSSEIASTKLEEHNASWKLVKFVIVCPLKGPRKLPDWRIVGLC